MTTLNAIQAHQELDQPVFIRLFDQEQRAALAAGAADDGPLSGVQFAVKDNIDVAGVPTTAACPTLSKPATQHATVIRRLLTVGAVPMGKTNMDQFATGLVGTRSPYGSCHSVFSAGHVSGGSSSGSAIAVASGIVPLALGTDTAGSGRVPAAFNGIVGYKPSRGLVSNAGLFPACRSLDCITTFTRTVGEARTAFEAIVGPDSADPYSRALPETARADVARQMRVIAVPRGQLDLDDLHRTAWTAALAHAQSVARLVHVDVDSFLAAGRLLYSGAFVAERLAAFGSYLEPDGPHLDPIVRKLVLAGRVYTAAAVFEAQHELRRLRVLAREIFVSADALLLPTTPGHPTLADVAAAPVDVNTRLGTYTNMANLLDLCAAAVPAGTREDGLPFGIQLMAPAFADYSLLNLAARYLGEPESP